MQVFKLPVRQNFFHKLVTCNPGTCNVLYTFASGEKRYNAKDSEQEDIKYFNIARAVDISPLQEYLSEIIGTTDNAIQKRLLKTHLKEVQRMSLNGEIVERQSFIMINSKRTDNCEKDLLKRCMELSNKFERCDIKAEILDEASLIQLCNSFLNMNYAHREDSDIEDRVVMLKHCENQY